MGKTIIKSCETISSYPSTTTAVRGLPSLWNSLRNLGKHGAWWIMVETWVCGGVTGKCGHKFNGNLQLVRRQSFLKSRSWEDIMYMANFCWTIFSFTTIMDFCILFYSPGPTHLKSCSKPLLFVFSVSNIRCNNSARLSLLGYCECLQSLPVLAFEWPISLK